MLTPEQIAALSDKAEGLCATVNDFLLDDICRRIAAAGQFTSSAAYQIYKAQTLGFSRKQIEQELQKRLGVSKAQLKDLLTQSAEVGYNFDIAHLSKAAVPFAENRALQQIAQGAVTLANQDFQNITQTLGMVDPLGRPMPLQKAYQSCMDYAFQQVSTGATDYTTAIRRATKNLADLGVRVIDYKSGVHTGIEAAVRRNIMGGMGLMQEQISQYNHDALGADGWEISAHAGSAPDHEPIQGRQYSDEAYARLNNSLVRRIGTLNCGHAAFSIILGLNTPQCTAGQLQELQAQNAAGVTYQGKQYTLYEATQKQRQVERAIRKQKNRILAATATDDGQAKQIAQIRLSRLNVEYAKFSKAAGLKTQRERAQVVGFGKNQAGEAYQVYQQQKKAHSTLHAQSAAQVSAGHLPLQSNANYGIIKPYTREQADNVLRPVTETLWTDKAGLTKQEKAAAYQYTCGSGPFNRPLRGYDKTWKAYAGNVPLNNEGAEQMIYDLSSAINKADIPTDMWLFRGSDRQSLGGLLGIDAEKISPSAVGRLNAKFQGQRVKDTGFFSTGVSPDAGFKDAVQYEILAKKGSKGLYAEPFSRYGHTNSGGTWDGKQGATTIGSEAELILQRDSVFEIIEIKLVGGQTTVVLELK